MFCDVFNVFEKYGLKQRIHALSFPLNGQDQICDESNPIFSFESRIAVFQDRAQ